MVDLLKTGLYIGSAYILAQGLTEEKILSEKNVRNVVIGGLAGHLLGDKLEQLVKKELTDEDKKLLFGTGIGATIGALAGYQTSKGAFDSIIGKIGGYFGKKKEAPDYEKK